MGKELNKIQRLAKLAGHKVDADALFAEVAEEVVKRMPAPPAVNTEAFLEDVAVRVEARVGAKLAEVLDSLKTSSGEKVDTKVIIDGVASLLQPQILQASKQAAEQVFEANAKVLLKQINDQLQPQPGQPEEAPGDGTTPVGGLAGMSLGGLLQFALGHAEEIAKLAEVFKPKASADQKIAEALLPILKWHRVLNQLEAGKGSTDALEKSLAEIVTKPQP